MSETGRSPEDRYEARLYEIRLKGHLDDRWVARFEGLSFTHASDGTTILAGPVIDQAALHGLLRRVRDLGLPLLSVREVDPKEGNESDVNADREHHHSTKETDT